MEGQNIPFEESQLVVYAGNQIQKTESVSGAFPTFNSTISFNRISTKSHIILKLEDVDEMLPEFEINFSLSRLNDQKIHDRWVEFQWKHSEENDNRPLPKVHIQFQHIYCRSKVADEVTQQWRLQIKQYQRTLNIIKKDLNMLYSPQDFLVSIGRRTEGLQGLQSNKVNSSNVILKGNNRTQI